MTMRTLFVGAVLLAASCRPGGSVTGPIQEVYTPPDTLTILIRAAAEHPGAKLRIKGIATRSLRASDFVWTDTAATAKRYQVTMVELEGTDSVQALVFVAEIHGKPVQVYGTGILEGGGGDCGALRLSLPEVRATSLRRRPLFVVTERHAYVADCISGAVADTTTAHYLDVRNGFREVLRMDESIVRMSMKDVPCDAQCWERDTLSFRSTYVAEDDFGFEVDRVAFGPGNEGLPHTYHWNSDSTAIVAKR